MQDLCSRRIQRLVSAPVISLRLFLTLTAPAILSLACAHKDAGSPPPQESPANEQPTSAPAEEIPATPGMSERRYENLKERARARLACDEPLTYEYVGQIDTNVHNHRMKGCGKQGDFFLVCTGFCTWIDGPERIASSDLQCAEDQLTTKYLGGWRSEVQAWAG